MRLVNWLEVLDPANPSGVLEKLLQKFDTGPSESSESSTFQHFQRAQQHVIFLMVFASLAHCEVYGAMKAFAIKKSTITSCNIYSARPLCRSDAFQVPKPSGLLQKATSPLTLFLILARLLPELSLRELAH